MEKKKELLMSMGMNDLEADVYLALLNEDLVTGYRIGKILAKPTANVYKAIESLAKKGAVILEDEKKGLCKAVSTNVFFDTIEAGIQRKAKEAKQLFTELKPVIYDERSYQLQSAELALAKSRQMLSGCSTIAVIDAFPKALKILLPVIKEALARGVEIYVQGYEHVEIPGAHFILTNSSAEVLQRWNSQQLNMVIDGKEYILALFNQELTEVYHATWSCNLYLACMYHIGFVNENTIHKIQQVLSKPDLKESIEEILAKKSLLSNNGVPGVEELLQRFQLTQ